MDSRLPMDAGRFRCGLPSVVEWMCFKCFFFVWNVQSSSRIVAASLIWLVSATGLCSAIFFVAASLIWLVSAHGSTCPFSLQCLLSEPLHRGTNTPHQC